MRHTFKIENLDIPLKTADALVETLKDFAEEVGFSLDRIEALECRSRDGFIPHSYNLGGISCTAYRDQYNCGENTGFKNTDQTLTKYWKYDFEYVQEEQNYPVEYSDWTDEQREYLDEARSNDSEATVLFGMDIMLTSFERGIYTINLRLTSCAKDSPYHRQYDDLEAIDIKFRTLSGLERQLKKLLKNDFIQTLTQNLREAY